MVNVQPLPAWFARLSCVALVIVAITASAASEALSTTTAAAARRIRLRSSFVDLQRASAHLLPIQSDDSLVGFSGVGHLDKSEAAGAAGLTVGHDTYFFARPA